VYERLEESATFTAVSTRLDRRRDIECAQRIAFVPITSRLPPKNSFDPETIGLLTGAFEDAWRSLDRGDGIGPDTDAIREMLARHIITLAQTGERDVIRLRDGAVAYVKGALERIEAMREKAGAP
jgi:hypothetical protein